MWSCVSHHLEVGEACQAGKAWAGSAEGGAERHGSDIVIPRTSASNTYILFISVLMGLLNRTKQT